MRRFFRCAAAAALAVSLQVQGSRQLKADSWKLEAEDALGSRLP
jgi:hypothetical protein